MTDIDRSNRTVLASLEGDDGLRCVDIYRTNDGEIFWDEWRRDPEDPSGWRATGRRSRAAFETEDDAKQAAVTQVDWLKP